MQLKFLLKSLWHFRRSYLGVVAGTIVGATVLLGAILAGDSVNHALLRLASLRIGQTDFVLTAGDHFFSQELADTIDSSEDIEAAPALLLISSASRSELNLKATQVQTLGVDRRLWQMAPQSFDFDFESERGVVAVNRRLAERLRLEVGDSFVFRVEKPGLLSRDAPLSGSKDNVLGLRARVARIIEDDEFGRFSLEANQIAPFTIFAPISWIQDQIEYPGRINLLLAKRSEETGSPITTTALSNRIKEVMTLSDYGLTLLDVPLSHAIEVRSERVFVDPPIVEAIQSRFPQAQSVITYLANTLQSGDREAPYSFVTAASPSSAPFLPQDFGNDDTVINQWLADDLQVGVGDQLSLSYYVVDESNQLLEQTTEYTIRDVVPLQGLVADRLWMPDFPGVSEAEDSSDWEPGMPLDLNRIRDSDEIYWDDYRGVPKAFITIEAGIENWSNRWGDVTALRVNKDSIQADAFASEIKSLFDPSLIGMRLEPIREKALSSAQSPVDIGGLFISMSFFLIIASLSLTGMLFAFSMQRLNRENALLEAIGIRGKRIFHWRMASSLLLVSVGSIMALPIAAIYTWGILRFLETIWSSDSVGTLFNLRLNPTTIGIGILANIVLALLVIWQVLRRQSKRQASIRLQQGMEEVMSRGGRSGKFSLSLGVLGVLAGIGMIFLSSGGSIPLEVGFFLTGFSWLVAGLTFFLYRIRWMSTKNGYSFGASFLGQLNNGRRPMRSLTVAGTLACGVFLVVSVAAFRKENAENVEDPKNGYGGYTYWVETSIPINDANDLGGSDNVFGLSNDQSLLPIRLGQGDDASCFNLNQTANPRLLAVKSDLLAERNAFDLRSIKSDLEAGRGWALLQEPLADDVVPALIDSATLQWALKRKVGDRLSYIDGRGRPFEVEIIGTINDSLFQGSLLVDEKLFLERFPQNEGYRLFLVDDWSENLLEKRDNLEFALNPWGGQVDLASDRLQSFHEVENTYIAIFHVLGGLGVILGSAGLGVVVARNLAERRHEFALLGAIGIGKKTRNQIVFAELRSLIGWGMGIGLCVAIVSILPSMRQLGVATPVFNISLLAIGILANAAFWSWLSCRANQAAPGDLQREFDS